MTTFKTITQEQLDTWKPDGEHVFDIELRAEHFMDWLNNIPSMDEEGHEYDDYTFSKYDDEIVMINYPAPEWMCEVDLDELDQAVLDKLHLKMEWIEDMPCNG